MTIHLNTYDDIRALSPRDLERMRNAILQAAERNRRACQSPKRDAYLRNCHRLLDFVETRLAFSAPRSGHPNLWPYMRKA